jgi:hypothetical protein
LTGGEAVALTVWEGFGLALWEGVGLAFGEGVGLAVWPNVAEAQTMPKASPTCKQRLPMQDLIQPFSSRQYRAVSNCSRKNIQWNRWSCQGGMP